MRRPTDRSGVAQSPEAHADRYADGALVDGYVADIHRVRSRGAIIFALRLEPSGRRPFQLAAVKARVASEHGNFWLPRGLQPRLDQEHARRRIQVIARTGLVLLECPTTGMQFNAGIRTDAAGLAALVDRGVQTTCPHCANRHGLANGRLDIDLIDTPRMPSLPLKSHTPHNAPSVAAPGHRQQPPSEDTRKLYTGL